MTSSPPDISSLTLAPQRTRPTHDTYDQSSAPQAYHFQTSPAVVPSPGQRRALPSAWLSENDSNTAIPPDARSMSPPQASDISSGGGSPPSSQAQTLAGGNAGSGNEDDIIPTAIVIKNIPFNVKRETLLDIIASLSIPTPYAFNYHLDPAGQFRGLAFANFRVAADADAVVAALNGFDVQGRKLRVEYKKVLQAGEKERIEREKALRRMRSMQMEKEQQQTQHPQQQIMNPGIPSNIGGGYDEGYSPLSGPPMLGASRSFQGIQNSNPFAMPPMPVPQPYIHPGQSPSQQTPPPLVSSQSSNSLHKAAPQTELDLNDPATLEIYSRILLFKDDHMRDELAFARSLSPKQRRIVHLVAQKLGVYHYSIGEADERYAVVTRRDTDSRSINTENGRQTPIGSNGNINGGNERIGLPRHHSSNALNRSFLASSGTGGGGSMFSTSTSSYSAGSSGLSNGNGSPSSPIGGGLRSKKSMPDMKSLYTPQPRLTPRSSNGNMREGISGYAALRRQTSGVLPGLNQIFGSQLTGGSSSLSRASVSGAIGQRGISGFQALDGTTEEDSVPGSAIPPVPMLPEGVNVVRQPRGPGAGGGGGFGVRRQSTIGPMDRGLDSRTHEPLEI